MGRHRLGPPSAPEAEPPTLTGAGDGDAGGCPVRANPAGKQRARPPGLVALRDSLDVPNPRGPRTGTARRPVVAPAHQQPLHRPGMDHRLGVQPGPDHAATRNLEQPGPRRAPARRDHPRDSQALHTPRLPRPDTGGFSDLDPATGEDRTTEARTEPPGDRR